MRGMTERDLLGIRPKDYEGKILSDEEIFLWFNISRAGWVHDGDPKKPHAELYGLCSNGYFDLPLILCYPNLNEILVQQLVQKLKDNGVKKVGWVISTASAGSILFSYEIARALQAAYVFVDIETRDREMVWRRTIPTGAIVLQVEDLIIADLKAQRIRQVVNAENQKEINFLPVVAVLVHRLGKLLKETLRIVSLIEKEIWEIPLRECPLCATGSPPLNPKIYWDRLIGME